MFSSCRSILLHFHRRPQSAMSKRSTHHYNKELATAGIAEKPSKVRKVFKHNNGKVSDYVYRMVLTGGPCGGKSSSLYDLTKTLTSKGYDIMCVPEVPTILMNGGCQYPGISAEKDKLITFEKALIEAQLQLERSFVDIAQGSERPTIVIMDRGLIDVAAYLPDDLWQDTLKAVNLTEETIAQRYDLVLHLVTAADGAETFYTCENNEARKETPAQARELDSKIRTCYERMHENVKVVDNSTSFKGKMKRATDFVLDYVGASSN
jgi:predicted ATPase